MKRFQKVAVILLLLLIIAAAYGLWETREQPTLMPAAARNTTRSPSPPSAAFVDQSTLKTAQQLAQLATTPEERSLAQEALRLADYDVDLAFATALQNAKDHPPALNPEAKKIQARLQKAQALLGSDQARVAQLTDVVNKAKEGPKKQTLEDNLANVKAQLELDQDEVDDAKQDLIRAGGDPEDRIQEMVKEHDSTAHNAISLPITTAPPEQRGLIHRFQQWSALHAKQLKLWEAKSETETAIGSITAKHNALDAQVDQEKLKTPHLAQHSKQVQNSESAPQAVPQSAPDVLSHDQSAAQLALTQHIAGDQKTLAAYGKRIEAHKELAEVYAQWILFVQAKQREIVHRCLIGVSIILVIALAGLYSSATLDRVLGRLRMDRRQVQSLRTVTRVTLQIGALLLILLVIFGPPGQLGTFLGLAGAGLTVALKDFIVGFIGWFVLMGKNGIRLGDWVEINGVTGEVVEIGPFHTVLFETGNWTDSGHPTGRRVTFTNSYAIEGHYFNFSTAGQWLWDELQVVLPTGQDPYPMIDAIRKRVMEATQASAAEAEQEWHSAAPSREMKGFSATPAVSVKPVLGGIEVDVRYIARASERYTLRSKLNQEIVELLGAKGAQVSPAPVANS